MLGNLIEFFPLIEYKFCGVAYLYSDIKFKTVCYKTNILEMNLDLQQKTGHLVE